MQCSILPIYLRKLLFKISDVIICVLPFIYKAILVFEIFLSIYIFCFVYQNIWKVISNVSNKNCSRYFIVTICQYIVNYCNRCFSNSSWFNFKIDGIIKSRVNKIKVIMCWSVTVIFEKVYVIITRYVKFFFSLLAICEIGSTSVMKLSIVV